jgi:hypothetical protein
MADEHTLCRYRNWYGKLLRLYPKSFRERFGEGMEQTFNDFCRERSKAKRGLLGCVLWMFIETFAGIMRENITLINKNILRMALGTAFLLLIPLLGRWPWSLSDFVVMGGLIFGTGLAYELIARQADSIVYRAAVGIAVVTSLLLVWINLAVGFIGDEDNPANLMYGGVLAIGIIGAFLARFQPQGMARALFATALAQALVPVIALMIWTSSASFWGAPGMWGVFGLNAFFAMLFAGSALLFQRAARKPT